MFYISNSVDISLGNLVFHPACVSSNPVLHMMYTAFKLNKLT